ncbi:MAG: TonB-dependent receptor [Spongiibacteraceae bacterium]|nr:TonB-dependent receptor [Spongiibacteraceae bacterium]
MRQLNSKLKALSAAILTSAVVMPVTAVAQDRHPKLEEVVITGSNIRRNRDFEAPSPIQTLGTEQIQQAGAGQIQDLFKTLTVNAGSTIATSQNSRMGQSQFSLRGLGVGGTLTLVNGRRAGVSPIATGDGAFYTDSNQYPVNMIERVEVLTDGASATYGSEAVGGVVNLITRNDFEGFEIGVEGRDSTVNKGYQINAAVGSSFDNGHFTTFVNYYRQDGAFRGDFDWLRARDNSNDPGNQLDSGSRWDSGTGAGRYDLATDIDGDGIYSRAGGTTPDAYCGSPNSVGVVNTFVDGSNCKYSFIDQRRLIGEETRFQSFTAFNYEFSDSLKVFSELSFSSNEIRDAIGGAVLRDTTDNGGFFVAGDHPFNYFVDDGAGGITWDEAAIAADPTQGVDVIFRGRPLTTFDGELADDITRKFDNTRVVIGADADLNASWSMNSSYMYARTEASERQPRSYNADAFRATIGSGLWNPFGIAWADPTALSLKDGVTVAGNSEEDLKLISTDRVTNWESVQQVAEVIFSGDLIEMDSGTVGVAIGAQYRDFAWEEIVDSLSYFLLDARQDGGVVNTVASQDVYAVFAEALIPATDDIEIQLALRYEDYGEGEGGDTTDPKVGVKWNVTDMVMLRSSWGTSFQAPTVRHIAGAVGNGSLNDSVTGLNPGDACNATSDSFNATFLTQGGDLSPQSATNYNFGAVLRTESFTGSLDYFVYEFEDRITEDGNFQDIVDRECSGGVYTPSSQVKRDPSGQLQNVSSSFVNIGGVTAEGFDLNMKYIWDGIAGGTLTLGGNSTFITTFDMDVEGDGNIFDGANNRNRFIGFGSLPELRANMYLNWQSNIHSLGLTARYIGGYDDRTPVQEDAPIEDTQAQQALEAENAIDSQLVFDFQYGIELDALVGEGTTNLTIGVNNITNEDPPNVEFDRIAFDGEVHDPRGRVIYARAKYNF